ncbi:MAG: 4Fe-4S binding protein [Nitrososphaeria archaeon]
MYLFTLYSTLFALIVFTHIFQNGSFGEESYLQKKLHTFYAKIEPTVVRIIDRLLKNRLLNSTRPGKFFLKITGKLLWFLPHGVVIEHDAALRLIDSLPENGTHIAIGPCVCKKSIGVKEEPYVTDMVIMYGAEAYKAADPEEYVYITKEEAKRLLKEFYDHNLIHEVFACFKAKKWAFVICNCDARYCMPTRSQLIAGEGVYPGPLYAVVDSERCKGIDNCGTCINLCKFNAIIPDENGKACVKLDRCMGCGLCAYRCPNQARKLVPRQNYDPKFLPIEHTHPNLAK